MVTKKVIKVLIVDDSAMVRKLLTEILASDKEIQVIGTAMDAYMAREKIKRLNPDVITLDVEMPKMDGVTFLRNLMRLRPTPVLMVSTLTEKGAEVTLDALRYGAVDFVTKPKIDFTHTINDYADEIITKVKVAARARVKPYESKPKAAASSCRQKKYTVDEVLGEHKPRKHFVATHKIVAIGASTGGTEAIREILDALPITTPGIVITQHIPPMFSAAFARRVNASSALNVIEVKGGEQILPGHAYIAPGDRHLQIVKNGAQWNCKLSDEVPVNRHRPSIDILFRSVAQNAGPNAVGLIMTGMGKDGALGLKEMQEAGAYTIAQDEASSVVWGMAGAAVAAGAVQKELPLQSISSHLISHFS